MGVFNDILSWGKQYIPVIIQSSSDGEGNNPLTPDGALRVQTVYSCVRIISEDVGTLPIHVKERVGNTREVRYDHPVARLLEAPNPYMSGIDFRRALVACLELHGNAYAHIAERDGKGYAARLEIIDPTTVTVSKGNGDIFYQFGTGEAVPSRDVIHLKGFTYDGIVGKSPISLLRESIENAANSKRFSKNLFKRDLKTSTVFSLDKKLNEKERRQLGDDLNKMLKRSKGVGTPIILEDGMKVSSITLSPEDAQFVQYSLMTTDEIAAGFRVPPHKVGDWTRGTYSNNTQANLEYFTDCIRPLLETMEAEFNRKLLLERERSTTYIDINFKGLIRASIKEQMELYAKMYSIGVYSSNDIRRMEDLPAYEGGDRYYAPVNMAEVTKYGLKIATKDEPKNNE